MAVGNLVKAIYDFSTDDEQELPLCIGDIVQITKLIDKQWSHGVCHGKEGNFPLNYTVELKIPWCSENQQLFAPICDFLAQQPGDLSFKKGDLVLGLREIDENWWEGQLNGASGIFPLTHVWKINHKILPSTNGIKKLNLKAKVKMNLKAQLEEEIDLLKDDIVIITEEVEKGWYRGECNGKCGIFPASFVTIIDEDSNENDNSQNNISNLNNGNISNNHQNPTVITSVDQYGYDCVNSGITAYGCTIYPFPSKYPDELGFEEGEIVNLIRHVDDKWMEGEINGRVGIFPKDFINIIVDCPGNSISNNASSQDDQMFPPDTYGRVLSTFHQSNNTNKLSEGDTITLIRKVEGNLYEVLMDNDESCFCPADCIEVIGRGPDNVKNELDACPPSYLEVMKDQNSCFVTYGNSLSRKHPVNCSTKNDRPLSYPSTASDQSSFTTSQVNTSDHSMKSFCSIDEKIAENLGGLDSSQSTNSSNNQSFIGRSFSLSGDSGYSSFDKSRSFRNRLTSSPLPMLTITSTDNPFDNWNDASYANLTNEDYANVQKSASEVTETPKRPPHATSRKTMQNSNRSSSTFSRQSSITSSENESTVSQQITDKELQLKRVSDCKMKLEKYDESNAEAQKQISQYDLQIQQLNQEIEELRSNASNTTDDTSSDGNSAQRSADAARKKELEEKRRAEERKKKMEEQRACVITEIVQTERDYLSDLKILHNAFLKTPEESRGKGVDVATIFGNLDEVIDVASRLLRRLEKISKSNSKTQMIGECFVDMADEMKETYGHYCRNHDDVNAVLDKYHERTSAGQYLKHKVEALKRQTNCFDLPSMLIKPVQRILKYPLLLNELVKCTDDGHPDKQLLIKAIGLMTEVATAINEFKRRQDLVFKYRKHADTSLSGRISKINFHSMQKKTSRFGMRFYNTLGLTSVMKDEHFMKEQQQFRALEKSIKIFLKDVNVYMEKEEELVSTAFLVAEDIADLYEERKSQPEVDQFRSVHRIIRTQFWEAFKRNVERNVISILKQLLSKFVGPNNLIEKRDDKLLDYEICTNKLEKNKDATKLKMLQDNQVIAKNTYEALNSQLLDDLPKLYASSVEIFYDCLCYFLKTKKNFLGQTAREMRGLKELSLLLGSQGGALETFQVKHTLVTDNLCQMILVPKDIFAPSSSTLKRNASPRRSNVRLGGKIAANSPQTQTHLTLVKSSYPNALYSVTQDYSAADLLDLSLRKGDMVGVIKKKDPMGGSLKWFVDNGVAKGFVPAKFLSKVNSGPMSFETTPQMVNLPAINNNVINSIPRYSNISPSNAQIVPNSGTNIHGYSNTTSTNSAAVAHPHNNTPLQNTRKVPRSISIENKILPVRPAPPVNSRTINKNSLPKFLSNVPNNADLKPTTNAHRYEEINEITSNDHRYDVVSQDESLINQTQSDSAGSKSLVAEFDPYGPIGQNDQLYDNVPSEIISPIDESHRYEVIPEQNTPEEYYYSLYDFAPLGPNQMHISKGQVILVLQKCDLNQNSEWWFVEDRHGNKGYVPGNYLNRYPPSQSSTS